MKIFLSSAKKLKAQEARYEKMGVQLHFIGRLNLFPKDVQDAMHEAMEMTKNNSRMRVNVAMGYGGREEVLDAVRKIGEQIREGKLSVDAINEQVFEKALYMDSEPDLIIRTGGDHRTSNFLIWQSHYSEWLFVEKLWPEFAKEDLLSAVELYASRERRFGK